MLTKRAAYKFPYEAAPFALCYFIDTFVKASEPVGCGK